MSITIPQIGDRVRICYTGHVWYDYTGVIVGFTDENREQVEVQLDGPRPYVACVGVDQYEYLGNSGEGFAYATWMYGDGPCEGPLSRWPAHYTHWQEMQAELENAT